MPVELPIAPNEISADHLVKIYELFCKAYSIELNRVDERFLRRRGIKDLHEGRLDYRPCIGAKFFGQNIGNLIQFHGYGDPDKPQIEEDKKFEEMVIEYWKSINK